MSAFSDAAREMADVRDRLQELTQATTREERHGAWRELPALFTQTADCLERFASLIAQTPDAPAELMTLISLTDDLRDAHSAIIRWRKVVPIMRKRVNA